MLLRQGFLGKKPPAGQTEVMETFKVDESFVKDSGQFDLTLIVDKHEIHVCKAVLCVASPVFRAMFKCDLKEKEQNEIQLQGKNYNDVVSFLNCIYPDRMESLTNDTVYRVVPLAHEYQVNALEKKCQEFLINLSMSKYQNAAMEICRHIQISEYSLGDLHQASVSIASRFSLEEFERAAEKYPVTDRSLVKIHREARIILEKTLNNTQKKSHFHW